jgi:hypothetical protein
LLTLFSSQQSTGKVPLSAVAGRFWASGVMEAQNESVSTCIDDLFETMQATGADFTNVFRLLANVPARSDDFDSQRSGIVEQLVDNCCSVEHLKKAHEPQVPKGKLLQLSAMAVRLLVFNCGEPFLLTRLLRSLILDQNFSSAQSGFRLNGSNYSSANTQLLRNASR